MSADKEPQGNPDGVNHNWAGRIWTVSLGLFLILLGGFFAWYLWAYYKKASQMDDWVEVPCLIEKSEIDHSGRTQHHAPKYSMVVEYRYQFAGKEYRSNRFQRIQPSSAQKRKIESKRQDYPEGSSAVCYVDPANPERAVLKKDSKASLYSIWFPGLFVFGGLGMVVAALRGK